jgi:Mg2+ and Co2+ transporter CorA
MTTHRLRYLQSLRKILPENTPPFDILLHKRTPTHQLMPHLVVQCGETHVHSLSESLATILTGMQSALYIPRFVFEKMSDAEASSLFESHDSYVKALNWLPLFPLLSNLDRVRKEYNTDGTVTERTTREWARSIKTLDGSAYAQCDVVNGGTDQRCYLLFPSKDKEAAQQELDAYRRRLYPFTQREAKFREDVGPPPVVHLSKRVIANLDFIKRLSSDSTNEEKSEAPTVTNDNSKSTTSSVSSVSQVTRPPTSGDTLRKRYREVDKQYEESLASDDSSTSTTDSTVTDTTKNTTGRISVSSAKFREFDAILLRQKQEADHAATKASDRISTIERQLHRFNDLEQKLSDIQQDLSCRFNLFEGRLLETMQGHIGQSGTNMSHMESRMSKLMSVVEVFMDQKLSATNRAEVPTDDEVNEAVACTGHNGSTTSSNRPDSLDSTSSGSSSSDGTSSSGSSSGTSSMDAESTGNIQSPEHKRQRSSKKKKALPASIRRNLDNQTFSQLPQQNASDLHPLEPDAELPSTNQSPIQTPPKYIESGDDTLLTPRSPTPPIDTPDPESQYTEKSLPPKDTENLSTTGNTSHRRESRG